MVNYATLDQTFGALADATRRGILEQLARGQARVSELAKPFSVSAPAISKHLRVLEAAGLIERDKVGREHRIRANPAPIEAARDWMSVHADAWRDQFDALDALLQETKLQDTKLERTTSAQGSGLTPKGQKP